MNKKIACFSQLNLSIFNLSDNAGKNSELYGPGSVIETTSHGVDSNIFAAKKTIPNVSDEIEGNMKRKFCQDLPQSEGRMPKRSKKKPARLQGYIC